MKRPHNHLIGIMLKNGGVPVEEGDEGSVWAFHRIEEHQNMPTMLMYITCPSTYDEPVDTIIVSEIKRYRELCEEPIVRYDVKHWCNLYCVHVELGADYSILKKRQYAEYPEQDIIWRKISFNWTLLDWFLEAKREFMAGDFDGAYSNYRKPK